MMTPDHRKVFLSRPSAEASQQVLHDGAIDVAPELTHVEILWIRQRVENRVRFGRIEQQHVIDRHWRVVSFAPDSIFAFLRWASNAYGTAYSQIDILRAVAPGEGYVTAPHVHPGGDSLLHTSGWPKVEKVLHAIEVVEPKRWASIPPTSRPSTGGMFTIVCPSATGRNLTRKLAITLGGGGSG
jgi:Protein of unknown function (DUF2840)